MIQPKTDKEIYREVLIEVRVKDHTIETLSLAICKAFHEKKLKNTTKQLTIKL